MLDKMKFHYLRSTQPIRPSIPGMYLNVQLIWVSNTRTGFTGNREQYQLPS